MYEVTCKYAQQNGHLDICRRFNIRPCEEAAKGGKLKILQWLRSKEGGYCPWDKQTCRYAAKEGHFEVLKWARENDYPWDALTCRDAALRGNLEILKWAILVVKLHRVVDRNFDVGTP